MVSHGFTWFQMSKGLQLTFSIRLSLAFSSSFATGVTFLRAVPQKVSNLTTPFVTHSFVLLVAMPFVTSSFCTNSLDLFFVYDLFQGVAGGQCRK